MANHPNKKKQPIDKFSPIDINSCKRLAKEKETEFETVEEYLERGGKITKDKRIRGRNEKKYTY